MDRDVASRIAALLERSCVLKAKELEERRELTNEQTSISRLLSEISEKLDANKQPGGGQDE